MRSAALSTEGQLGQAPSSNPDLPLAQGLYDPAYEHDSCGVNFVADLQGRKSHKIVATGFGALCNLQHRGAVGAEENTGDGSGMLLQVPDKFLRAIVEFELPAAGSYVTGIGFLPADADASARARTQIEALAVEENFTVLGWREVPTDPSTLGSSARSAMPSFWQPFLTNGEFSGIELERRAYMLRKRIEHEVEVEVGASQSGGMGGSTNTIRRVYFPSFSCRTFVYKGMLTTPQLADFFPELMDERVESALAIVHSRFSTNTFPSWPLAHPFRYVAHNGEINTVQGNRNWMRAREDLLATAKLPGELERIFPICNPGASDTAAFDEVLELLHMGGYSLPEAIMMMIPEPWERHESMDPALRAYYRVNASMMEPWDGPASIVFSDGNQVGAILDRNGLRPSRYWVTDEDMVIMASEVGVVDVDPAHIVEKGRLRPGRMFLIDFEEGRIVRDHEIKQRFQTSRDSQAWLDEYQVDLSELPSAPRQEAVEEESLTSRQLLFGYTHEELKILLAPMAIGGKEAIGSMGTDTPLAVLSNRPRLLFDYFKQLFAQVTNPPLDAMREELVTAVCNWLGPESNLLGASPQSCEQIFVPHPVITTAELGNIAALNGTGNLSGFNAETVPCVYEIEAGGAGLRLAIQNIRSHVDAAIAAGKNIIILSDRETNADLAPIPSVLAVGAVHHHLVREKTRSKVGIVVETGEAREVHHICMLLGYGATAVNPYLAFDTIDDLVDRGLYGFENVTKAEAHSNYIKACDLGALKIMSKMGISTVRSYTGSQIFEAIGLGTPLVMDCFTGTVSRLGGIGYAQIAMGISARHALAYPKTPEGRAHRELEGGGDYKWRREGEYHLFNPETVFKLQHGTRSKRYDIFKQYTKLIDDQSTQLATLRGLFRFRDDQRPAVPIDEVEPVSEIVKRFSTGAMSYGSISAEAHESLAIAMNRIGAKSNTGEGGENPERFTPDANGDSRRSAIKQAASGRFGVTSDYLVNADDIQIKMAQGAKPGEGGQLPGHKVWPWIAEVRHSTVGVGLISPPPHHDIYSIEDLAQLIYDLKNANPQARIHVKLVAELGVGTVAAGVAKAHADVVLISGYDGGTGASPLTSVKHAGTPWELGLAETQQTLLLNGLRDRIVVQTDGQLKTGRDVMIATLLGAEEFGFATAPLVVQGCVMMRACHLDTCPVGVATQNPELRKNFSGKPEFVVTFMEYIAEEVRELLAELGFRTIEEAIGRVDALDVSDAIGHWKAAGLDLSPILHQPDVSDGADLHCTRQQDHGLVDALDNKLIALSAPALERGEKVVIDLPIRNVNRTVGTMLGNRVTVAYGAEGLPDDTIHVRLEGAAGNSLGAFLPRGITLELVGDANDYVGKGLSGGRVSVRPADNVGFVAEQSVIAGNVLLYGATGGAAFFRGLVGERFCVRNSGATAVVEGIGDHGCEYMTGGRAVILGETGRNFGAGMSGGIAFVYDVDGGFAGRINDEMVDLETPDTDDLRWLQSIVEEHRTITRSSVADQILNDWDAVHGRFVKVMPRDYKRVLAAQALALAEGRDPDEAVMAGVRG